MSSIGYNYTKGFTLVELLVVITVIGILSTVAMMSFQEVREQARDKTRMATIKEIQLALASYFDLYGEYPEPCDSDVADWSGSVKAGTFQCDDPDQPFILGNPGAGRPFVPTFMEQMPRDPLYETLPDNFGYVYTTNATRDSYKLMVYGSVEDDLVEWNDPLARCPKACDGEAGTADVCNNGSAEFTATFASTYAIYAGSAMLCK